MICCTKSGDVCRWQKNENRSRDTAELIAGGGKIQVPCLRVENKDGDVRWIYETSEIIRYLKTELVV